MSNISRRDFLKTAGVMTLAVAAAGVLAGCEGNTAKPEVPEVTQNSVTVGNYTLSLKDVKQYAVKTYTGDTSKPNEVESEERYVLATLSLKAVDEDKLTDKDPQKIFGLITKAENMGFQKVEAEVFNKMMGLTGKWVTPVTESKSDVMSIKTSNVKKGEGTYYSFAFKVTHTAFADNAADFKTPALSFVVNDSKGYTYTKIDAVIPAAVDMPAEGDKLIVV